jgi:hypothetical protein
VLRFLYEDLISREGEAHVAETMRRHMDLAGETRDFVARLGEPGARSLLLDEIVQESWTLYALSRVNDLLVLQHQPPSAENDWPGPGATSRQRDELFRSLGMHRFERTSFHPFFHEIVQVEQSADPVEPISLAQVLWDGYFLGALLVCRAGVVVHGGSAHVEKRIAEQSTLYFAYRRRQRACQDLSMGWGHNSQWRTSFRRDYAVDGSLFYNVDGKDRLRATDPRLDEYGLSAAERIELLTNRCFILTEKGDDEFWPYGSSYVEQE